MTTRALEDQEIKAIFEHISGTHAKRNETLLITGIGLFHTYLCRRETHRNQDIASVNSNSTHVVDVR